MKSVLPLCCVILAGACAMPRDAADSDDPAAVRIMNGIEFRAETLVMESYPVQLRTIARVTNRGDAPARVTFPDGCVVLMRAYSPAGAAPVWDEADTVGCTLAIIEVTLLRRESREFSSQTVSARQILGDSLPDGRYEIRAYLRPDGTPIELTTGNVDLAVPRN
jgi:hypothetical protein